MCGLSSRFRRIRYSRYLPYTGNAGFGFLLLFLPQIVIAHILPYMFSLAKIELSYTLERLDMPI